MIPKDALALIDEIKKSNFKLTKWEIGFIATVNIQAKQGRYLQSDQSKKLNEIYRASQDGRGYQTRQYGSR